MCNRRYVIVLLVALLALIAVPGYAQNAWLDSFQQSWNLPGGAIPAASGAVSDIMPLCQSLVREPETAEDAAVAAQGWRLYGSYQRGWGITLVGGFLNFDGMCREVPYQQFVFVDGVFAGTLAPVVMYPSTDGALSVAAISGVDRLYATYDRYAPGDPLYGPSSTSEVTFSIERTANGPVVTPDLDVAVATPSAPAGPVAPADATRFAVCVGLGGDALSLVYWTAEEISAQEERTGPVVRAHPKTGGCMDLAGLPVLPDGVLIAGYSWLCSRTFDKTWFGPHWVADIYRSDTDVPPDPAIGGCPRPRDETMPPPSLSQQAAATAVYLSQLEAVGHLETLYDWLHPDAQAEIPKEAVTGWYTAEWLPRGPQPITVTDVEFGEWTWDVTGETYPNAATIAYEQSLADGSTVRDGIHLVQDDQGLWRWFFGRDRAFVQDQITRYGSGS